MGSACSGSGDMGSVRFYCNCLFSLMQSHGDTLKELLPSSRPVSMSGEEAADGSDSLTDPAEVYPEGELPLSEPVVCILAFTHTHTHTHSTCANTYIHMHAVVKLSVLHYDCPSSLSFSPLSGCNARD